jgi:hypothetical protein
VGGRYLFIVTTPGEFAIRMFYCFLFLFFVLFFSEGDLF